MLVIWLILLWMYRRKLFCGFEKPLVLVDAKV